MGYQDLAYAIVTQAIEDYREYRPNKKKLSPLKDFFKSEWCNTLIKDLNLTGEYILRRLESETN